MRPGLDDKVLADWNGLMIAALANASQILGEPSWLTMAQRAFAFIARAMTRGDRLGHSWRQGQLKFPGLASDFAAMIRAALALYEATGRQSYLEQALSWQRALDRDYANAEEGTYYLTAADAEGLVIRPASTQMRRRRTTMRSPRKISSGCLCSPATITGATKPTGSSAAIAPAAVDNLYMHIALMNAIDLRLRAAEIVVTGRVRAPKNYSPQRAPFRRSIASCCMRGRPRRCRRRIRRTRRFTRLSSRRPLSVSLKPVRCR